MKIRELFESSSLAQMPWNGNVNIGWWADNDIMRMYHGTNIDFIGSIAKEGLNRLDPNTGMISLAFEPFTARAFAVMGGEARFLSAKSKARSLIVPENKRCVLVLDIPKDFVFKYIDRDFHGNDPEHKHRLVDKSVYEQWNGSDQQYYQLCEMRLASAIPPEYLTSYMLKS